MTENEKLTLDEAIAHAREVAKQKYAEGMLCHANPNDDLLDGCIKCVEEHELLAKWLEEIQAYREIGTIDECRVTVERMQPKKAIIYKCTKRADCPDCGATVKGIKEPFGD